MPVVMAKSRKPKAKSLNSLSALDFRLWTCGFIQQVTYKLMPNNIYVFYFLRKPNHHFTLAPVGPGIVWNSGKCASVG